MTAEKIAGELSEAQRRVINYLADGWVLAGHWISDNGFQLYYANRYKFAAKILPPKPPRPTTVDVLQRMGVLNKYRELTPLGQEVRAISENDNG